MATLSSQIGIEWEIVATQLGLRRDEVDRLKQDFPKAEHRTFNMLVLWREKQSSDVDQLGKLVEALNRSGRSDLADNIKVIQFQGKLITEVLRGFLR